MPPPDAQDPVIVMNDNGHTIRAMRAQICKIGHIPDRYFFEDVQVHAATMIAMAKGKKIARTGINRDYSRYMYYVKDGAIWQSPRKGRGGRRKKLVQWGSPADMDYDRYLYYIDKDGDVVASAKKTSRAEPARTTRKSSSRSRKTPSRRAKTSRTPRTAGCDSPALRRASEGLRKSIKALSRVIRR